MLAYLRDDARVTHLVAWPGAAIDPPGDAMSCDVAREAASDVIGTLKDLGLAGEGAIAIEEVAATSSRSAERAEAAAPGAGEDGIVWDVVLARARADAETSWAFYAFLCLATTIAGVAVLTDSAILVVGAMVVGPEFGPVAATCVGIVLGRPRLALDAARLIVLGFAVAIAVTGGLALLAEAAGWIDGADLARPRPNTGFIWSPDRWSFVVALLAGAAGVLSLTAGRSSALVGVFISVTTVPAAGNLALAARAAGAGRDHRGRAQLGVNLLGMVIAGTLLLAVQRLLTSRAVRDYSAQRSRTTSASSSATFCACASSTASTITRTSGSVPDGRSSTRPVSPSWASAAGHGRRRPRSSAAARDLSTPGTFTSTCGSRSHHPGQVGQRPPGRATRASRCSAVEHAVAGGRVVEHDDVPGLLAAEASTRRGASPRARTGRRPRSATVAMPCSLHRELQAEVAHHRGDQGVVGEVAALVHREREDRHDLVAVHDRGRCGRRRGSGRRRRRTPPRRRRPRRRRPRAAAPGASSRTPR